MKKLLLIFTVVFTFQSHYTSSQVLVDTAIDFSLYSTHNQLLQLYPTLDSNKIVVIDFFNTSCGPCSVYAPDIQKIYEDYGYNQQNVRVWGLDWGNTNAGILSWDSTYGISYPTVSGGEGGANLVNNQYGVQSRPTLIIITPDRLIFEDLNMLGIIPDYHNIDSVLTVAIGTITSIKENPVEKEPFRLKLSPNPAKNTTYVKVNQSGIYQVLIFNLAGRSLLENKTYHDGNSAVKLDVSNLPGGFYIVKIIGEDGKTLAQRLMISR